MDKFISHWAVNIVLTLIAAWFFMLGVGMWHAADPSIPTIPIAPAFVIMWSVSWAVRSIDKTTK